MVWFDARWPLLPKGHQWCVHLCATEAEAWAASLPGRVAEAVIALEPQMLDAGEPLCWAAWAAVPPQTAQWIHQLALSAQNGQGRPAGDTWDGSVPSEYEDGR